MAIDPYSTAIEGAGMVGNLLTGRSAQAKQKQLTGTQYNYARRQLQQYDQYRPQYNAMMEKYGQDIGAIPGGPQGYVNQTGVSPHQAARLGIDPNTTFQNPMAPGAENGYLLGPYAQQSYRLLRQGAEQDIQRQMQGQDQNLLFQLGQQGIATGSQAAALGREHSDMLRGYSDYLRNLAISAGDKQQQQQQQYIAMLQGAMAPGSEGAGIIGQQAQMYGNQAQNAFGAMGQTAQNWVQNRAQQQAMQQLYGGGGNVGAGDTGINIGGNVGWVGAGGNTWPGGAPAGPTRPPLDPGLIEYLRNNAAYGYG